MTLPQMSFLGKKKGRENLRKAAELYTYIHTYIHTYMYEACRAKMPIRVRIGVVFKKVFGFYPQLLEKSCV